MVIAATLERILSHPFTSWRVFLLLKSCWRKSGDNKNTTRSCPRDTLRHWLKVHIVNAGTELQDTQQKVRCFFLFSYNHWWKWMKTAESRLFFHVPMIMGLMKNGHVEDLSWMSESPSMLINVATKKHGTKYYQKQPSLTCLWFLFRASHLEAFHESRVTSKHILCMGTASLMFEISGWSLPGIVPKELWESKLPTNHPVFFLNTIKDVVFLVWRKTIVSAIPRACSFSAMFSFGGDWCKRMTWPPGCRRDHFLNGAFIYLFFHPDPWGNDPIWLVFFKRVETTN